MAELLIKRKAVWFGDKGRFLYYTDQAAAGENLRKAAAGERNRDQRRAGKDSVCSCGKNDNLTVSEISRKTCGRNHLGAVYYDNTFAGKYQLHFDGNYRWSTWDSNVLTHYKNDMYGDVSSSDHRSSTLWAGNFI